MARQHPSEYFPCTIQRSLQLLVHGVRASGDLVQRPPSCIGKPNGVSARRFISLKGLPMHPLRSALEILSGCPLLRDRCGRIDGCADLDSSLVSFDGRREDGSILSPGLGRGRGR